MSKLIVFLTVIYSSMAALFLLDVFNILEIKEDSLKGLIHFGSLILTPIILIFIIFIRTSRSWNLWMGIVSLFIVVSFSIVVSERGMLGYLLSTNSWKTQTILYENGHFDSKRIEFQMKDIGALGYRKRYVRVLYITNWFMITEEIDLNKTVNREWIKVDKDVNELNISY